MTYQAYLMTPWWRYRRNQALRDAGYQCQRCSVKRDLQVHHTSYERLGAELPADLEVVCRGCHLGHHVAETQESVGLYMRVISEVVRASSSTDAADIIEEAKQRLAALNIPIHHERFHVAMARLMGRLPEVPERRKELYDVGAGSAPLTRSEAAGILSKLHAKFSAAGAMKHMPQVKPLTLRAMNCRRAAGILAQAIQEQIERCEVVESQEPVSDVKQAQTGDRE